MKLVVALIDLEKEIGGQCTIANLKMTRHLKKGDRVDIAVLSSLSQMTMAGLQEVDVFRDDKFAHRMWGPGNDYVGPESREETITTPRSAIGLDTGPVRTAMEIAFQKDEAMRLRVAAGFTKQTE